MAWKPRLQAVAAIATAAAAATVFIAYAVAANVLGPGTWPRSGSWMPALWAAIFALWAILAWLAARLVDSTDRWPRWRIALAALQLAEPLLLLSAFGGACALGDTHAAAWSFLAAGVAAAFAAPAYQRARERCRRSTPVPAAGAEDSKAPLSPRAVDEEAGTGGARNASAADDSVGASADRPSCKKRTAACMGCTGGWLLLLLSGPCLFGYAVQGPLAARERILYPPPGELFPVHVYGNGSDGGVPPPSADAASLTTDLHIFCTGAQGTTAGGGPAPVFLLESGAGTGSFEFYGMQLRLAELGWRSCAYDRPGYGWSGTIPLGAGSVHDTSRRLAELLAAAGESGPFIVGGHSAGVEISQVFAVAFPSLVAGYVAMDGYPDYLMLQGFDSALVRSNNARVCAALQAARTFEAVALTRLVTSAGGGTFTPQQELARYLSLYGTGHNWQQQFNDYCTSQGGPQAATFYLASLAPAGTPQPIPAVPSIGWPALPAGTPALLIPAGLTVVSLDPPGNAYATAMLAYNATLSPGHSALVVCEGCSHAFPWEQGDWLADTLHAFFAPRVLASV